MKLSMFTDLGLRTLMLLAGNPEHPFSTRDLAEALHVSRNHLTKVVSQLAANGYVTTRRGNRGGIRLAHDAKDISVGDVISHLERDTPIVECFRADGGNCRLAPTCQLASKLARARSQFIDEMNRSSLSDISYTRGLQVG